MPERIGDRDGAGPAVEAQFLAPSAIGFTVPRGLRQKIARWFRWCAARIDRGGWDIVYYDTDADLRLKIVAVAQRIYQYRVYERHVIAAAEFELAERRAAGVPLDS